MKGLLSVSAAIDRLTKAFGWVASWLVLISALISAGNAASRYLLNMSSNAWLEIQWQMFAGIFLLGGAYVLQVNEHVRVDLFYGSAPHRRKLWIDVIGIPLFRFPSVLVIGYFSWSFFLASYAIGETSSNAGGLLFWPVKLLLPLGLALVFLQGVAELIKRVAALRDHREDMIVEYERPLQ